jgi:hypothetical protein
MQLHTTKRNWFANNVESTESKRHFWFHTCKQPISLAERSKATVCGSSLAGFMGLNPVGDIDALSCESCVLSRRGICDGPIPRPEGFY